MGLIYETADEATSAAHDLRSLGAPAIKLMREVVEHQELHRTKASDAAKKLEGAGFIRIMGGEVFSEDGVVLRSCLAGEEALDALDESK